MLHCMKAGSPPEMFSAKKFLWIFTVGHYYEGNTCQHGTVVCIRSGSSRECDSQSGHSQPGRGKSRGLTVGSVKVRNRGPESTRFTHAAFQVVEPVLGVDAVNYPPEEPELCRYVIAIVADVLLGDFGIRGQESFHTSRLGENVGGMAQLGCLSHNRLFQIENVFVTEQVCAACALREQAVEERIVAGTPVDLRDVKIARNAKLRTYLLQFSLFQGLALDECSDSIQGRRV